jgi:hypothetical protein
MTEPIPAGTVVEVTDRQSNTFQYAAVVDQPADWDAPNDDEDWVWVRYGNGCTGPKREYHVRALTADQVVARLNAR